MAAEDLIGSVPWLDVYGPVTVEVVDRVNGWNVTPATMLRVSERVEAALASDDVVGAIVTHGTDTLGEMVFLCDVTVRAAPAPAAWWSRAPAWATCRARRSGGLPRRERGLPVVVATRVPEGGTGSLFGGPGGGATLQDVGVVAAGSVSAAKGRLLLMLLLAGRANADTVRERFREAVEALGRGGG